ncbi:MAK10-like protein [Tanacetum coccineum]
MHIVHGDDVAGIKRRLRDLSGDGIRNLATASRRGRLKEDLESSTWRRHYLHNHKDHLGKFDEKADDGYFIGYSLVSKPLFRNPFSSTIMRDANPIRTLGDYSKPSHEGYRNTIELPVGNNVVPLRSDTIRLVQNGCSFHGLWSEDPNQHLKDFLKLVDSLDLDGENRERTRLRLFQFSLRDQASNWLERLPAGSITTWEDLTTRFLAQFFPPGRTAKLRNDILMFQQHQGESLSEAWTRFKDLLQKVPHHGIDLWLQVQIFYDHVTPVTRRTIDQSAGGKLRDRNAEESWALLEDLALYDNESWNDPRDFAKPVKAISLPQDVPSTSDRRLIELKNQVQRLMEAHLAPMQPTQVNKITSSCEICSGPHDTQYCMENPEQAFVEYASSRTDEAGGKFLFFYEPEPQPQPLPNYPPLDASLGSKKGLKPPIEPHGMDSFRMNVLDNFTICTPPSSLVASFHFKDLYCYYHPCIDDPKKHYGFKPGLLGHTGSLGVDFPNMDMKENEWELESKKVSFLGRGLNSPVRQNEVELYLMRRSLEILRKFHWMILGGRFNQISHVSSSLLSKPVEY